MGYPLNLSCADRVRFDMAEKDMGVKGDELARLLLQMYFNRKGVKNPKSRRHFSCPMGVKNP